MQPVASSVAKFEWMAQSAPCWGHFCVLNRSIFQRNEIARVCELTDPERPQPLDGAVQNLGAILGWEEAEVVAVEYDCLVVGELLEGDGPISSPHEALRSEGVVEALYLRDGV